jgi:site-specific DNA-cytosine methylase
MFPDCSLAELAETSLPSSLNWTGSGLLEDGQLLTLSSLALHSADSAYSVCSLAEILEPHVAPKYYLSPRACRGILRRAKNEGERCRHTAALSATGADPCGADDNQAQAGHLVPYNIIGLGQQGHNHAYQADVTGTIQHKGNSASGNEAGTVIAFDNRMGASGDATATLRSDCNGALPMPSVTHAVRRLTPVECERLQGFPDGWTASGADGPQADSTRYRQLGNAVVTNVAEWIGRRIVAAVEDVPA